MKLPESFDLAAQGTIFLSQLESAGKEMPGGAEESLLQAITCNFLLLWDS